MLRRSAAVLQLVDVEGLGLVGGLGGVGVEAGEVLGLVGEGEMAGG
jgi:hypothetical protein